MPLFPDFYVLALDVSQPNSTPLVYGTLFGGSSIEREPGNLSHEGNGVVTFCGATISSDFPTTAGAIQSQKPSAGSSADDAVVSRIDTSPQATQRLLYSTYLGGSNSERNVLQASKPGGRIHVILETTSSNLPFSQNAQGTTSGGSSDTYYASLDPSQAGAANLRYGSFVAAGNGSEFPGAIGFAQGRLVMFLTSGSTNLPVTPGAFQPTSHSNFRGYLLEYDVGSQLTPQLRTASHYGTGLSTFGFSDRMGLSYDGSEVGSPPRARATAVR